MFCHYVTRRLTRKWEFRPGRVRYYDFETGAIREGETKTLFAVEHLNSKRIESRLNSLVENPIRKYIDNHAAKSVAPEVDWVTNRAFHLYFLLQVGRLAKARPNDMDQRIAEEFDALMEEPDEYLDQLVAATMHTNVLMRLTSKWPLLFPSDGFFATPLDDTVCLTGRTLGYVVPVDPHIAYGWVPETADTAYNWPEFILHIMSVGLRSRRVVLPPTKDGSDMASLAAEVADLRVRATHILAGHHKHRKLTVENFASAGISVAPLPGI